MIYARRRILGLIDMFLAIVLSFLAPTAVGLDCENGVGADCLALEHTSFDLSNFEVKGGQDASATVGCAATASDGGHGQIVHIFGDEITNWDKAIIGKGGNGGDATASGCENPIAKGGSGGRGGILILHAPNGTWMRMGKGGDGGDATAWGTNGTDLINPNGGDAKADQTGQDKPHGKNATAYGGQGGIGSTGGRGGNAHAIAGRSTTITNGTAYPGGNALAMGGNGGTGTIGGTGGNAFTYGGTGSSTRGTTTSTCGTRNLTGGPGGNATSIAGNAGESLAGTGANGGSAFSTGGSGGQGAQATGNSTFLCQPPGLGGPGGFAIAIAGNATPSPSTASPGIPGNAFAIGGDSGRSGHGPNGTHAPSIPGSGQATGGTGADEQGNQITGIANATSGKMGEFLIKEFPPDTKPTGSTSSESEETAWWIPWPFLFFLRRIHA